METGSASPAPALANEVFADLTRRESVTVALESAVWLEGGFDNLLVRARLGASPPGWPDDVVIRVLPGNDRANVAAGEVLVHGRCIAAGLPVPPVLANGTVPAGPYLVMPFIDAAQALSLLNKPWSARRVGELLGNLHGRIHGARIDETGVALRSIDYWLETLDNATDDAPASWRSQVEWLKEHRERAGSRPLALCHFDFQFMNVLVAADGATTVLDWDLAGLGDPLADCAFALEFLSLAPVASGATSASGRFLIRVILSQVARGYLRTVRKQMTLSEDALSYWRALYCTVASGWALGLPIAGIHSREEVVASLSDSLVALAAERFQRHTRR